MSRREKVVTQFSWPKWALGWSASTFQQAPLEEARRRAEEKSLEITWHQADLEQIEFPTAAHDVIVNFNHLQRSLFPPIQRALKSQGQVIFETYLIDQQRSAIRKIPPTC